LTLFGGRSELYASGLLFLLLATGAVIALGLDAGALSGAVLQSFASVLALFGAAFLADEQALAGVVAAALIVRMFDDVVVQLEAAGRIQRCLGAARRFLAIVSEGEARVEGNDACCHAFGEEEIEVSERHGLVGRQP
jgi:hypothetical protein